jgi:hypothetical protein
MTGGHDSESNDNRIFIPRVVNVGSSKGGLVFEGLAEAGSRRVGCSGSLIFGHLQGSDYST